MGNLPPTPTPTSIADLIGQAKNTAKVLGLDPALVCAVIEQESSWNTWAVRFEPAFYLKYIHPPVLLRPTTEQIFEAASFGLMQIMGATARAAGFKGVFLTQLCYPAIGIEYGCRKLAACVKAAGDERGGLLRYNGGGNPGYPDQVLARVAKYTAVQ